MTHCLCCLEDYVKAVEDLVECIRPNHYCEVEDYYRLALALIITALYNGKDLPVENST